jgi:hypothetical protein
MESTDVSKMVMVIQNPNTNSSEEMLVPLFLITFALAILAYTVSIFHTRIQHIFFLEKCKFARDSFIDISSESRGWYTTVKKSQDNQVNPLWTHISNGANWLLNKPTFLTMVLAGIIGGFSDNKRKEKLNEISRDLEIAKQKEEVLSFVLGKMKEVVDTTESKTNEATVAPNA